MNMKTLLMIPLLVIGLISCTSHDDIVSSDEDVLNQDIQNLYDEYKADTQEEIGTTMGVLNATNSRAAITQKMTGSVLVEYIASLSSEKVDSLYSQYCTSEEELKYDNLTDSIISVLIENSSLEEVQKLFNFKNEYIESGGHNMTMLVSAISDVSPLIKNCMISCAANVDEFIEVVPQSRAANSWCLHQLSLKLAESYAVNGIADVALGMLAVPGADAVGALVLAGYDLYSSIEMAHEYNMCCVTHVS